MAWTPFFHDGAELVAVDDLGGADAGVAGEAGDFLDGDAADLHECVFAVMLSAYRKEKVYGSIP